MQVRWAILLENRKLSVRLHYVLDPKPHSTPTATATCCSLGDPRSTLAPIHWLHIGLREVSASGCVTNMLPLDMFSYTLAVLNEPPHVADVEPIYQ